MDTSKTYIKMCERSPKIQLHKQSVGDFYSIVIKEPFHNDKHSVGIHCEKCRNLDGGTWLPQQDQLQEMVDWGKPTDIHPQDWVRFFNDWIQRHDYRWIHFYASMEQLWLAFYMSEKFNKYWNGEEWLLKS